MLTCDILIVKELWWTGTMVCNKYRTITARVGEYLLSVMRRWSFMEYARAIHYAERYHRRLQLLTLKRTYILPAQFMWYTVNHKLESSSRMINIVCEKCDNIRNTRIDCSISLAAVSLNVVAVTGATITEWSTINKDAVWYCVIIIFLIMVLCT